MKVIRPNWTPCPQQQGSSRREDRCMRSKKNMKIRRRNLSSKYNFSYLHTKPYFIYFLGLNLNSERQKKNWDRRILKFKSPWSSFRYFYRITKRKRTRPQKKYKLSKNLPRKKKPKSHWRGSSMRSLRKRRRGLSQRKRLLWNMKISLIKLDNLILTNFQKYQILSIDTRFWSKKIRN